VKGKNEALVCPTSSADTVRGIQEFCSVDKVGNTLPIRLPYH